MLSNITHLMRFNKSKNKKPRSFQEKRGYAEERWSLIAPHLPKQGSILDLGCDEGQLTERCASSGLFALGVERSAVPYLAAKSREREGLRLAFVHADITDELLDSLPHFDCVLLLSVHHHFWRLGGRPYAEEVLRQIAKKCDRMIYEAPIRTGRYRPKGSDIEVPEFTNLDAESAASWHEDWVHKILPEATIKFLGYSPCIGEREPVRPVFRIDIR